MNVKVIAYMNPLIEFTKGKFNMKRMMAIVVWLGIAASLTGCSAVSQVFAGAPSTTGCKDPLGVIKSFYNANDAAQYDTSLALLSDDVVFASWAEGMNGHHMIEKHLSGKEQVREILGNNGLRFTSTQADGPRYAVEDEKVNGDAVTFFLRPDRMHVNGRPYNPYMVTMVFDGCKIKSLTVIEEVTWV